MSLRVALTHPTFWPEANRGAERLVHDIANQLGRLGADARIISSHPNLRGDGVEAGVPITRVRRPLTRPLSRYGYSEEFTHLPWLRRELGRHRPDVVHAFYPTDALLAGIWASSPRVSVFTVNGIPLRDMIRGRPGREGMWRQAARRCDAVVTISHAAARDLSWIGDVRVIENGVDEHRFTPGGERSGEPLIFCPAAADDPRKGVADLIEAFGRIRYERPGARLLLHESAGPLLPTADSTAAGIEMADFSDRQLVDAYRSAWVTVLPSRREGFGLILAESLACGTPIVGSDDAGIPEILGDAPVGRLTPPGDVDRLTSALDSTLGMCHDRATVEACLARARELSIERTARRYLELYEELAEPPR